MLKWDSGAEWLTLCKACHDSHGIIATQSTAASGTNLINFDRTIALPLGTADFAMPGLAGAAGRGAWEPAGRQAGASLLTGM